LSEQEDKKVVKCVVWDLDNTVWDGVLLEDPRVTLRRPVVDCRRACCVCHRFSLVCFRRMARVAIRTNG